MKNLFYLILCLLTYNLNAQVTNGDDINYEIQITHLKSNIPGTADLLNEEDICIITEFHVDGGDSNWECVYGQIEGPGTIDIDDKMILAEEGVNKNIGFVPTLAGWEDDSEWCDFDANVDILYHVQDVYDINNPSIVNGRPICAWTSNWSDASGNWIFGGEQLYDLRIRSAYRPTAGDKINEPLTFGNLFVGDYRIHSNANRPVDGTQSGGVQYWDNSDYQASADVFYSFTVNEPSLVTISTSHSTTNFDTYIYLEDSVGNLVDDNDDGGGNTTSVIVQELPVGLYYVIVEGHDNNPTGLFSISVELEESTLSDTRDIENLLAFSVSPNPASEFLNLKLDHQESVHEAQIQLITIAGQVVFSTNWNDSSGIVDIKSIPSGIYLIEWRTKEKIGRQQIVIE
jgi:hypothetical protein